MAVKTNGDTMIAPLNTPTPYRIAILGAGQIGSAFAFYLAQSQKHDITLIARAGSLRLAQLQRDGGVMTTQGQHAPATITDQLDVTVPYDLVLVTVKAYQFEALLPALKQSAAKEIHFMFMTFTPEHLQQAVGHERVFLGMPFVQSQLNAQGRIKVSVSRRPTLTSAPHLASLFNTAKLPARYEPHMALWLRCHVPLGVAFESVATTAQQHNGKVPWRTVHTLAVGIRACFALIRTQGYEIYPNDKKRLEKMPLFLVAGMLWGLSRVLSFRALLATGDKECSALIDTMLAALPTTTQQTEANTIRAMKPD